MDVARDGNRFIGRGAKVNSPFVGARAEPRHRIARQLREIDRLLLERGRFRTQTRQLQQLFDQMLRASDARAEFLLRLHALGFVAGAFEQLQLQAQGGDGRAQLMGRIGQEVALQGQCAAQARHEVVHRADQQVQLQRL